MSQMISEDQIKMVVSETMAPRSMVVSVVLRLWRAGQRFTCADVMAAAMEIDHPALAGWRARSA